MAKPTYELIDQFRQEMNVRFDKIENEFVRKSEFNLIKTIVFTMCGIILVAFLNNLLSFDKGERSSVFSMEVIPTEVVRKIGDTLSQIN